MSCFNPYSNEIQFADSPNLDAFGRLRVSSPFSIFDSKQIHDNEPLLWDDQEVSGSGTSSTHSTDTASSVLAVSATTAGLRMRQTFMRFNYQAGKSHRIFMTFGNIDCSTGIIKGLGYGDDNNGLFLVNDEGTLKFIRRTYTSGSAVDNESVIDTTGLDLTKTFILDVDFEWLGVGRIRAGFVDGVTINYFYTFTGANNLGVVYMSTPNLPLRAWIENTGTGAADSFSVICSNVMSEGGQQDNATVRSVNVGTSFINAGSVGTYYAILGIRLKTGYLGSTVKPIVTSLLASTNDSFLWELRYNPTVAGTFTYSDVTNSTVQLALGDTAGTNTVTGGTVVRSAYVSASSAQRGEISSRRSLGSAIDGTRDTLVLCVTPLSANLDIYGSLTFKESV